MRAAGLGRVSLRGRPGGGAPRPCGLPGATQRCQPALPARDGRQPAGSGRAQILRKPRGRLGRKLENCRPCTFFLFGFFCGIQLGKVCAVLGFFFFFSCCAGLFRFSSSFPHVCRFRASGGPVGYDPAPEERSPWDSGAGAPLPRVLSAVGARRDSGGSGRHRSACGTAVPSGLPVFFPVAAAQQHSSTPLSCTDNFPPRARVTRQRFISLFSPPIPCE